MQTAHNALFVPSIRLNQLGADIGQTLIRKAARLAKDIGYSYEPSEQVGDSFAWVQQEARECRRDRRAFRVWSGASDRTIYGSAEANYAFRFIHDTMHDAHNAGFDLAGEWAAHTATERLVYGDAFQPMTMDRVLFIADTFGQTVYAETIGGFIEEQAHFGHWMTAYLMRYHAADIKAGLVDACSAYAHAFAK